VYHVSGLKIPMFCLFTLNVKKGIVMKRITFAIMLILMFGDACQFESLSADNVTQYDNDTNYENNCLKLVYNDRSIVLSGVYFYNMGSRQITDNKLMRSNFPQSLSAKSVSGADRLRVSNDRTVIQTLI